MTYLLRLLSLVGLLSTALSPLTRVAASPVLERGQPQSQGGGLDLDLGLGLDLDLDLNLGGIIDLCEPPIEVSVVTFLTVVLGLTKTETTTTTYPCSTSTTFVSTWADSEGKHTATCRWAPNPPSTCVNPWPSTLPYTTVVTTTTTTTEISTTTATTTTTEISTTTVSTCSLPTSSPTLSCDQYGYLIQDATLYRVDLSAGTNTVVKTAIGDGSNANAIGYNVLDNYLYGLQGSTLLRIFSDGSSQEVVQAGQLPTGNVGDIDLNGRYWLSSGGNTWSVYDLYPGSVTYGQRLNSGTAPVPKALTVADWVYLPNNGQYLWSVAVNSTSKGTSLIRFSLTTFSWEAVANYPTIKAGDWGAQYGMNNGTIYASDNTSGDIWQFPISGAPFLLSRGPSSGDNDGARCVLNLL